MARRSSQEWQSVIEQQAASDLSVVDFCKQQQLDYKYFHARKRSLLMRQQRKQVTPFMKIGKMPTVNSVMELHLGNARLSIPANTNAHWLAQLFKAVAV